MVGVAHPAPTRTSPSRVSPTSVSPTSVSPTSVSPTSVSPTCVSPATLRRRPALWIGLLLSIALLPACESTNLLGGVWRATEAPTGDTLVGPDQDMPGVELVLGHYGPNVSGLVRFYRSDDYAVPREAAAPRRECACAFVHKGRWSSATERFSFVLRGCMPGEAVADQVYVRGDFALSADSPSLLEGTLEVEDPASSLYGRRQRWSFERFDSVSTSDLSCEPVTDADAGNTASGR